MTSTEIYIYNRQELDNNRVLVSKNEINNIIYITEKNLGSLYYPNLDKSIGIISYINELVQSNASHLRIRILIYLLTLIKLYKNFFLYNFSYY